MNSLSGTGFSWKGNPSLTQSLLVPGGIAGVLFCMSLFDVYSEKFFNLLILSLCIALFVFFVQYLIWATTEYSISTDGKIVKKTLISTSEYQIRPTTKYSIQKTFGFFKQIIFDTEVGFNFTNINPDEIIPILDRFIDKE